MPCMPGQPRDRVIIKQMTTFLAKERPDVVEMEELEKYRSGPIDTEGIIGVVAWSACAHEERRRCVATKRRKTLVADVEQSAAFASNARKGVPRAPGGHRMHKREAPKGLCP